MVLDRRWLSLAASGLLVAAACAGPAATGTPGGGSPTPGSTASATTGATPTSSVPEGALKELGAGEGALNLVAWPYYVEDGTTDPNADWVSAWEKSTGCDIKVTTAGTSDEMFNLMKTGQYDGVSASGDATLRLIAAKEVAPVNLSLIPNYANVFEGLKGKSHNTVNGVPYGVPHGRGANLLMWRTDVVTPDPDSWSVVWEANSPYKGNVTAYDAPIYIADAAVYLMATKPDLGIKDPYALDDSQFAAAIALLEQQKGLIGEYWSDFNKHLTAFKDKTSVVGTTWQAAANALTKDKVPVKVTLPKEGSTGWSDTWMISTKAKNPNCMYRFMDHIISPEANAKATVYFGEAPVSAEGCAEAEKLSPGHCDTFHATDEAYFSKVYYWNTPTKECIDGRGPICKDFAEWTAAWTQLRGAAD
ncbi:MAG TPA: extracellular solute-binding protein [Candidatus Limnocylindrales bacterium]|nr:extracellular solute-binding protein [Candidatus Limnocylindrales bacterium]